MTLSRAREPFTMLPNRFIDAEMRGELSERQAKLCRFIARNAFQRRAKLSLAQIAAGVGWKWSEDTLLRDLKGLRPAWFNFESRAGQRDAYLIRLTGLAVAPKGFDLPLSELAEETSTSAEPPQNLRRIATQEPPHAMVVEVSAGSNQGGTEPPQEPPQENAASSLNSYLYEGSEVEASSEEREDHLVGKTTTVGPDPLDALERARRFDKMYPPRRRRPS